MNPDEKHLDVVKINTGEIGPADFGLNESEKAFLLKVGYEDIKKHLLRCGHHPNSSIKGAVHGDRDTYSHTIAHPPWLVDAIRDANIVDAQSAVLNGEEETPATTTRGIRMLFGGHLVELSKLMRVREYVGSALGQLYAVLSASLGLFGVALLLFAVLLMKLLFKASRGSGGGNGSRRSRGPSRCGGRVDSRCGDRGGTNRRQPGLSPRRVSPQSRQRTDSTVNKTVEDLNERRRSPKRHRQRTLQRTPDGTQQRPPPLPPLPPSLLKATTDTAFARRSPRIHRRTSTQ